MISKERIINGETKKRTAAAGNKIFLAVLVCGGRGDRCSGAGTGNGIFIHKGYGTERTDSDL